MNTLELLSRRKFSDRRAFLFSTAVVEHDEVVGVVACWSSGHSLSTCLVVFGATHGANQHTCVHGRGPYAPKFEERSQEQTLKQETMRPQRRVEMAKSFLKLRALVQGNLAAAVLNQVGSTLKLRMCSCLFPCLFNPVLSCVLCGRRVDLAWFSQSSMLEGSMQKKS